MVENCRQPCFGNVYAYVFGLFGNYDHGVFFVRNQDSKGYPGRKLL